MTQVGTWPEGQPVAGGAGSVSLTVQVLPWAMLFTVIEPLLARLIGNVTAGIVPVTQETVIGNDRPPTLAKGVLLTTCLVTLTPAMILQVNVFCTVMGVFGPVIDTDADGHISAAALSMFGAASTPIRVPAAEKLLTGEPPSPALFEEAAE